MDALEREYRELLEEGYLSAFPEFTGDWQKDKEMFRKMSESDAASMEGPIVIDDEDDEYFEDDIGPYFQ